MKLQTILLFVAILLLGWIIYTRPTPEPNVTLVNDRIELIHDTITNIERTVEIKYQSNSKLEDQLSVLADSLESYKAKRDTVRIIQTQDTTIYKLKASNDTLKSILTDKDAIIRLKDNVIISKDTIISIQNETITKQGKKLKRVNTALKIVGGVLVGAVVAAMVK